MKLSKVLSGLGGCMMAAASLTGCVIVDGDGPESGSLTVAVTINRSDDPWQCFTHDVDGLAVSLVDEDGFVTEAIADCDDFGMTFDGLPSGFYDVEVWLLDFAGRPKSDIVIVEYISVDDGFETVVDIDFPSGAIDP
ncbi:hypothetical protein SOCEGT47_002120 [Sorangium cellulosum]|jgi:hypothetical protein|uniref:Secreted protein n=1 Tax=Sorangium cellulosum TaxID=56 RepID=A0A4P2PTA1_SORCE|nr:hypothetical protein [Sorangium cellulosum]AUX19760.1 hypothetical protein SOCEGT47_002120 [Sorangium cellulosum]